MGLGGKGVVHIFCLRNDDVFILNSAEIHGPVSSITLMSGCIEVE